MSFLKYLAACGLLVSVNLSAQHLRIATWNMEHLAEKNGAGCKPRSTQDYKELADFAKSTEVDVFAVQEVENEAALARVFPKNEYDLIVSDRAVNTYSCRGKGQESTPQRVGFAIKKSVNYHYDEAMNLPELALKGESLRYGMAIQLPDLNTSLLSVHLKSGCFSNPLTSGKRGCDQLAQQLPLVRDWIQDQSKTNEVMVVGDFNRRLANPDDFTLDYLSTAQPLYNASQDLPGCHPKYSAPIDHLLLSHNLVGQLEYPTAKNHTYSGSAMVSEPASAMLADHCPVSVSFKF